MSLAIAARIRGSSIPVVTIANRLYASQ